MGDFVTSGRIVDLILVLVLGELLLLVFHRRITGRGVAVLDIAFTLISGACLLLALRGALTGAAWVWIAAWLFAALLAHLADLAQRFRQRRKPHP
jgi:hypothetical protein